MAQKEHYSDDQLLDIVVRYADTEPGIIRITKMAKWASINIPGAEGIKAYHFRNMRKVLNPRTRKIEKVHTAAFERVQEINMARRTVLSIRSNILMHSSDVEAFCRIPRVEQRRQILEMRELVGRLISERTQLSANNDVLTAENERIKRENSNLLKQQDEIKKKQDRLEKKVSFVINTIDREDQLRILKMMGIEDGGIDLEVYANSLRQEIDDMFSIRQEIGSFRRKMHASGDDAGLKEATKNIKDIMSEWDE